MQGINIFCRGKDFYRSLEDEISLAKKEILINVYSFQNDAVGKKFVHILKRKLSEGVAVKIIIDALGTHHTSEEISRAFGENNDIVRVFRPKDRYLKQHPVKYFQRNHARIFLIDRKILGVGGMGIGEIYNERQDLVAFVPIADANPIASYFNDLWELSGKGDCNHVSSLDYSRPIPIAQGIQALISTPAEEGQMIYRWTIEQIRSAKERIIIVSAWFLPTIELVKALCDAKGRGVDVAIVTPSHTDKRWYDDFRGAVMPRLLKRDIVWHGTQEYFHQKYFIIDSDWCLGSANFDMVSMNRDYELNLCGPGGEVLQELQTNFNALINNSEQIRHAKIHWLVHLLEEAVYPLFEAIIVTRR
jgi:cardiolipin synthase